MPWDIDATPDDLTIRSGLLPDEHPLAAARGCVFALPLGLLCWLVLFGWLFAIGWLLGGIPTT